MTDLLACLKKHGQRIDREIADETGLSLTEVRDRFAVLSATGEVIACKLTRFTDGKPYDALMYRASGYFPPAAPGRKPKSVPASS